MYALPHPPRLAESHSHACHSRERTVHRAQEKGVKCEQSVPAVRCVWVSLDLESGPKMQQAGMNAGAAWAAALRAEEAQARRRRVDAATVLFVIGCAAAVLALVAMTVDPANSRFLGPCAPTDKEVADQRAASGLLLLAAAAQLLAATAARHAPACPLTIFACALAFPTAYRAYVVLAMVVGCHGNADGALAVHFWAVIGILGAAIVVAIIVAIRGSCA